MLAASLDHVGTRIGRYTDSLLVVSGTSSSRRRTTPVDLLDVLRAAAGQVEDYRRVQYGVIDHPEPGPFFDDFFGENIALSGERLAVGVGREDFAGVSDSGAAYVFRRHNGAWPQVMHIKASNAEHVDSLGADVDIASDGTSIVAAAPHENGGSSGVGGDQSDNSQPYAGAIYAFEGTYGLAP